MLVLTAGRLSDLFGRKQAYVGGFVLFALASLGAGFSADATQLILWRILQGIGGAVLFANSAALVTDAFPKHQLGLAMGTNTMVAAVGLVLGPVLGGALVAISWQWVFWFNVPLGLAGAAWGALVLRELARPDSVRGLDLGGTVVSIAFVIAIITAAVPKPVLFKIFSGLASGLSDAQLAPFIHNMHTALWVLAATSVVGALVSLLRPAHTSEPRPVARPAAGRA